MRRNLDPTKEVSSPKRASEESLSNTRSTHEKLARCSTPPLWSPLPRKFGLCCARLWECLSMGVAKDTYHHSFRAMNAMAGAVSNELYPEGAAAIERPAGFLLRSDSHEIPYTHSRRLSVSVCPGRRSSSQSIIWFAARECSSTISLLFNEERTQKACRT